MSDNYFYSILIIFVPIIISRFIMEGAQRDLDSETKVKLLDAFASRRKFALIFYLLLFVAFYLGIKVYPEYYRIILVSYMLLFLFVASGSAIRNYKKLIELEIPNRYVQKFVVSSIITSTGILTYVALMLWWNTGKDINYRTQEFEGKAYKEFMAGNYQAALTDYNNVLNLDSTRSRNFYNRGTAYYTLGNLPAAYSDWKKAASMGDTSARNALNSHR